MADAASAPYDPFIRGPHPVGVRTFEALDEGRGRRFPCELWYPATGDADAGASDLGERRDAPARPSAMPLVVYSHHTGGNRRVASFLCTHLASHGYAVAALDHSEVVAPELGPRDRETPVERGSRIEAIVAARVPDLRFLLAVLLDENRADPAVAAALAGVDVDGTQVGLAGHSFGGWTVLATPDVEWRVRSIVAMAPGGSSRRAPGILPLTLGFAWGRDVPTLYLAAEDDVPTPLAGLVELYDRTPASKRLLVLRRADHQHFVDDVDGAHEALRAMTLPGDSAWIPLAMRPMDELCSPEAAHTFVRGPTLAHFDATLRGVEAADRFLSGDIEGELAAHGVDAVAELT